MAMSYSKSRPRLGTEDLDQCPYEPSHWIRPTKLDEHVVKCRKNYEDQLFKDKGYHQALLRCMYNCRHEVLESEFKFHMARCPDRKKLWTYMLRAGPLKDKFRDMLSITGEDLPEKEGELVDLYDGLKPGQLITDYRQEVKLAHVGKGRREIAQYEAAARGREMAKEAQEAWNPEEEETKKVKKEAEFRVKYTKEEIDYWNSPGMSGKPYSWMLHNSRPQGYVPNYPPGLNKRERREFDKRNSELYEKKLAAEARAREAAEAARAEAEDDQGIETNDSGETEDGEIEEEDDDGWVSQFTHGPAIMRRLN